MEFYEKREYWVLQHDLIPMIRIYELYRQQKSEKRGLEYHVKFIVFKR